ncbi:MAG: hypothetical protein LBG91_03985 [Treponema sp.]|jgi:hypothetical protein|nr:hypothetical protein [Treponema sp.]
MRIETAMPSFYIDTPQQNRFSVPAEPQKPGNLYGYGVVVEISPEARAAYNQNKTQASAEALAGGEGGIRGIAGVNGPQECETCKNRKYVDSSNDPSVSFQAPAHISPGQAPSMVMSHEREHVSNEQARASRDDRRVVSQNVTLSTSVCPECGRVYISGGVTRTLTVKNNTDGNIEQGENDAEF